MEGYLGQIILFAGNFAPRTWAFCHGQLLRIADYSALFSIIGTTYGGDGITTFGLPDLRGRVAVGAGTGPAMREVQLGERAGAESIYLTTNQLPAHTHGATTSIAVSAGNATQSSPIGNTLATAPDEVYAPADGATSQMANVAVTTVSSTGLGQPIDNHPPYQGLNYIICLYGIYPSRD